MRRLPIARLVAVLVTCGCLVAPSALAAGRATWIVRDGFYVGEVEGGGVELVYFYVSHHRIYHLRFSMNLNCTSSGVDSNPNFNAGPAMPQGRAIPSDGIATISWSEDSAGRMGHITAELAFTRHPNASFSVFSQGEPEACNGFADIPIQRAAVTPPQPDGA